MFNDLLTRLAAWLGGSWLNIAIASHGWVVPTLQTIHILAVAAVLAGTAFINLRVLGLAERGQAIEALLDRFLWPVTIAVAVLAVTGVLQIVGEPGRAIFRTLFWIKLALTVAALGLTWAQRFAFVPAGDAVTVPLLRKGLALLALLAWLAVTVAGRWIAYVDAWPGAPS